ncbi:MAG: hypothetical protein ISN26_08120 [Betaproteobacteria bacterium AqS2]|uniref:Uncharacterized protein n=1 Tax=Candidatus Amphirhobacter heronislandensis TaxID=1732024 RepID=A0A930UI07_9GAMM|nr:hypothetical protein [Betaproteobacteria bacterium AqS2]
MSKVERAGLAFRVIIYIVCIAEYSQYVLIVREFIFSDADLLDRMGAMETMAIITTAFLAVISFLTYAGMGGGASKQGRPEGLRDQQKKES